MLSPQLLCAMVVECCAEFGDSSTLLNCSLVCRSWAQRSHQRYFKSTHVSSAVRAESFLRLISGPISFIGVREIQALAVGMDKGPVQDWCWEWLPRLLERLPDMKALTFLKVDYEIHTALRVYPMPSGYDKGVFGTPVSLAPASLKMTALKLVGCHFFSLRQLFLVLSQFILVESLTLERLQFRNPEPHPFISIFNEVYEHIQRLVYLRKLRIDTLVLNPSRGEVSSYITFAMPLVEVLLLKMPKTKNEWLMMQQFLHGLRGSLVELEWRECGDMEGDWNDTDLRLNLFYVRTIRFGGIREQKLDRYGMPSNSMIPLVLYQIFGGHELRSIILDIQDSNLDVVVMMNEFLCCAIDKGLGRPAFSNLGQLVIRVKEQLIRDLPMQGYETWIQSMFPLSYGRGIDLKVE